MYCFFYLKGSTTLTDITVGDNRFGDDAMSVMCEGLQHLCKLTQLNIREVGLTTKGKTNILSIVCIIKLQIPQYYYDCFLECLSICPVVHVL